jgi:hypothetical protein
LGALAWRPVMCRAPPKPFHRPRKCKVQ